ncbi:MAG: hypothetical protein U5N85_10625, partial [Arcicella sp.]|nr:hypothetical protein [Arcicella sp.]
MVRNRKEQETFTLFGGADFPIIIASGRSTNPSLFSYQKGNAALKHIRMSSGFFSTGFFRSKGISKVGNQYRLSQKIEAPYYQPLPPIIFKNKEGDYELSQKARTGVFGTKWISKTAPKQCEY